MKKKKFLERELLHYLGKQLKGPLAFQEKAQR